jgi:hypothetical protein
MKFLAVVVGCVLLAGCATETGTQPDSQGFAELAASMIEEAEAGGAGDAQLEILRQAQSDGKVSLEVARAANRAAVECVNDAGSSAFYQESTTAAGLVLPGFSSLADTPEQMAISDACTTEVQFWVSGLYQMQPASLTLNDAYLEQQAPVVRSCLERNGYAADPEATTIELLRQAAQVKIDTESAVDCLAEAKIDGF